MRCWLVLFFLFFLSLPVKSQNGMSRAAMQIEDLRDSIRVRIDAGVDTFALKKMVDSISREGNQVKSEYARLFALYEGNSDYYNNIFSTKDPKRLSAIIASFKTPSIKSYCKFNSGEWLCNQGEYTQGMELMLEALSECKSMGYQNVPRISRLFYLTSTRYYNFNNYLKCIEYAKLSAQYRNNKETIGLYNTLALAYQKLEQYDSAVIYFRETIRQAKLLNVPVWEYISSGNLGRTYCLQQKYHEGLPLLFIDVVKDSTREPINAAVSALYMAEAWCNLKNADSAAFFINQSKIIFNRYYKWKDNFFFGSKICWYYYQVMAQWLKLKENYAAALLYTDTAMMFEKKLNNHADWQLLTSTEKRIEGLEYQEDINLLAAQKKNEQLQKVILFIVLGSLLIISVLVIKRQKLKQQKERQLAQEKEANLRLKEEQARQELEAARQQLDDFISRMNEKNNMIEQMTARLITIRGNVPGSDADNINQQLEQLSNTTLLTQDDWKDFRQRFEKVYPGFFTDLSIAVPDITPAEERMMALLKLKISYRQMASMLGISPESVRTAKYRLRKKLAATGQSELLLLLDDMNNPGFAA